VRSGGSGLGGIASRGRRSAAWCRARLCAATGSGTASGLCGGGSGRARSGRLLRQCCGRRRRWGLRSFEIDEWAAAVGRQEDGGGMTCSIVAD